MPQQKNTTTKHLEVTMSKKSSVQWTIDELTKLHALFHFKEIGVESFNRFYNQIIENYTKMHKEEIKEAFYNGSDSDEDKTTILEIAENYYNETFGGNQ